MKPTVKSVNINKFIREGLGIDREGNIRDNTCVFCGEKVTEESFRDELSLKEYRISGICQTCQDDVFGK